MRTSKVYVLTALGTVVALVLAWFAGTWLGLQNFDLWLLRGILAVLVIGGAIGFLWLYGRAVGGGDRGTASGNDDVGALLHAANERLRASSMGPKMKLEHLPCLIVLGDSGSAKTTTAIQSGLEPELLSGQVYRDRDVIPTQSINVWYARSNVLLEVGGALLEDQNLRSSLFRKLASLRLGILLGQGEQAPRAVVLCVDAESFLKPGGAQATAGRARQLNTVLAELARTLGIRLPVYVLFTRMDRVAHFQDFAKNLTNDEAAQIFGASLPMSDFGKSGAYSEVQAQNLTQEFERLFRSSCDWRPEILSREHDAANLPSVYEFPRELRKLRSLLVQFLVDVCRPSELQTSPFLRGFYFTGVRPQVVKDIVVEGPRAATTEPLRTDATQVFNPKAMAAQASIVPPQSSGGRRVPQWVFLTRLFSDVILKDQAAQRSSGASARVSMGRRLLLTAATLVALVLATAWTISWFGNRSLAGDVLASTSALPTLDPAQSVPPSLDALQRLDRQREVLAQLTEWQRYGAPMHLRWGLYTGGDIYAGAYRAYFETFRRMLLRPSQASLLRLMSNPSQSESQGYRPVYDALKAYLITTSHHEKSTPAFLAPVLLDHLQRNRVVDGEGAAIAARQLQFYATELAVQNPFPDSTTEQPPVASARAYLARFAATDAIYAAMLSAANVTQPAFVFNQRYPGTAATVVNTYPVARAFTSDGWSFMKGAIDRPTDYFQGEEWVLGQQPFGKIDVPQLQRDLRIRYRADYVKTWRDFLRQTTVLGFASIPDAAAKLTKLSGNQSPLLLALCSVARNTSIPDKEISDMFKPPQIVEPGACEEKLAAPSNAAYMEGLIRLQAVLQQLGDNPADVALLTETSNSASAAQVAVRQLAGGFPVDREGGVDSKTQSLLEDPIRFAQARIANGRLEPVNTAARGFCRQYNALMSKFPFSPQGPEATLAEFDAIFKPGDGALWQLYASSLNQLLTKRGSEYIANPGTVTVTPEFRTFFNRLASVSEALHKGGSPQPTLSFSIRPAANQPVREINLSSNGQSLRYRGGKVESQSFSWPGTGSQAVKLLVRFSGGSEIDFTSNSNYSGPWGLFRLFLDSEHWQASGDQYSMEWTARDRKGVMNIDGRPGTVRLELDLNGAPPIFQPGYLSGLACRADAAR